MNIDRLVEQCYNALPPSWKNNPWSYLDHGKAILDSDDKLNAYIASYGEMHIMKCRLAMNNIPFDDLESQDFEIFDWGCGQGLGTLTLLQFLAERELLYRVKRINLIEPSNYAINRAKSWVSQSVNVRTEIRVFNRFIPSNDSSFWNDIDCSTRKAIHICSNILDIREVGLKWLSQTCISVCPESIFICVGPLFGKRISRIHDFYNYLNEPECFTNLAQMPCGYTSRTRKPFGIEAKCFKSTNKQQINSSYMEQSEQKWIDEYVVGEECLRGVIPDSLLHVYKAINRLSVDFKIFLKPSIGVERPDFILVNISKGVLILNVCADTESFERDLNRVEAIKQAFIAIYIKRLKIDTIINHSAYNCIKTGLYFPGLTSAEIDTLCCDYYGSLCRKFKGDNRTENSTNMKQSLPQDPTMFLIKLCDEDVEEKLSNISTRSFRFDYYQELCSLMSGDWHRYSQGDKSLILTDRQQSFVESDLTRLRVKGVAGCGKTQVLAHKAVREHIRTGDKVLIVTYNISLIEYIKMRINQVPADFSTNAFEIINYHQFFNSKAKKYSTLRVSLTDYDNPNFFEDFKTEIINNDDQYSTIIVDETQDYMTQWLDCLRKYFLKHDGRFILFGDGEQNIYNREMESDSRMPRVNGFGESRWRVMSDRITMRTLNPDITRIASDFAREYCVSSEPIKMQDTLNLFDYKLGYWPIASNTKADLLAQYLIWLSKKFEISMKEIVVLGQSINLLRDIDYFLRTRYGIATMTTFESMEDYRQIKARNQSDERTMMDLKAVRRVSKVHFTIDINSIKLSTISSFKGWESKTVVLLIQKEVEDIKNIDEDGYVLQSHSNINALLYTGITRARENLFIFNLGNESYHNFFKTRISND